MNKLVISTVLLLAVAGSAKAQFSLFRPVVSRQDGAGLPLANTGANVFLDEYLPNTPAQASPSYTVALPTASTSAAGFTQSGTATSEGQLTMSPSGIVIAGYSFKGGASIVSSTAASNPRRIALVNQSGAVTLDAGLTDAHSGGNPRSAVSSDGNQYWTAGSNEGIRWAANGAATTSTLVSSTSTNTRVVNIFAGQLYYSTGSGTTRGIFAVGSGLPTAGATASANFISTGAASSPYDYLLFDTNPGIAGLDTAYIADDTSGGGVQRWNFNGSIWSLAYTIPMGTIAGARGLAGAVDANGVVTMFATTVESTNNRLVRIDDLLSNGTNLATVTTLATAGTNQAFRGVEMFVPTPGAAALMGLGGLLASRRRRA